MTTAVAYSNFRNNLKAYMRKTREDAEPILVTNMDPQDNIVVMNADEYESLQETLRIYENPQLLDKILRGMRSVKNGKLESHEIIEDHIS